MNIEKWKSGSIYGRLVKPTIAWSNALLKTSLFHETQQFPRLSVVKALSDPVPDFDLIYPF